MRDIAYEIYCWLIVGLVAAGIWFTGYQQYVANHIAEYDIATIHGDACTPNSIIPKGAEPGIHGMVPPRDSREF